MSWKAIAFATVFALAASPSPSAARLMEAVYTGTLDNSDPFVLTYEYDTDAMTFTPDSSGSSLTGTAVRVSINVPGWGTASVLAPSASRVAFNDGSSSYQTDSASLFDYVSFGECPGGSAFTCMYVTYLGAEASVSTPTGSLPGNVTTSFTYLTAPGDTTSMLIDLAEQYYAPGPPGGEPYEGPFDIALFYGSGSITSLSVSFVPEPSTWIMMLLGFAGLGYAGHRRARAGHATVAG